MPMNLWTSVAVLAAATLALGGTAQAQSTPGAAQPAAKAAAAKPAPRKAKTAKPAGGGDESASRVEIRSTANNVAAGIAAAEAALTPAELAIAEKIYRGKIQCELGASVVVDADSKSPGYFIVSTGHYKFRMVPVITSSGAVRLEDAKGGGVWIQLLNKSMLMHQKIGARLADDCMSPEQMTVAERLKTNPMPSLLEPAPAKP